jgi:integrase
MAEGKVGFHLRSEAHTWQSGLTTWKLEPTAPAAQPPKCPQCGSQRLWKDGLRYARRNINQPTQRWLCRDCALRFSDPCSSFSERSEHVSTIHTKSSYTHPALPFLRRVCVTETEGSKNLAEKETTRQEIAPREGTASTDAKTEFADQLKRDGYRPDTVKQCVHYLSLFERKGINILQPEHAKAFIADQKWTTHSKATASTMYGIFAKAMHLQWNPPKYKYDQKIPFIPTEKEMDDLIAGTGRKTATFLRTLKETGCRMGEALRIKWIDIDFTKNTVTINDPEKNSLPRILKVNPTLMTMLNTMPKENESVFNRSKNTVESNYRSQRNKLAGKLGNPRLKQIRLSTFRHFYATMLFAKTLNILKVQQALGHKKLQNTQIYTHLINFDSDEYDVQIAENLEEAKKLLETGFDYVTDMDSRKLFRKRKCVS